MIRLAGLVAVLLAVGTAVSGQPTAPTNLKLTPDVELAANGIITHKMILTWDDNSDNEDYFRVERWNEDRSQRLIVIGVTPGNASTANTTDQPLDAGVSYCYRVFAGLGQGQAGLDTPPPGTRSAYDEECRNAFPAKLASVENFSASQFFDAPKVELNWRFSDTDGIDGAIIFRSEDGGPFSPIDTARVIVNDMTYHDVVGVKDGSSYRYEIEPVNNSQLPGERSASSGEVAVTVDDVRAFRNEDAVYDNGIVTLSWGYQTGRANHEELTISRSEDGRDGTYGIIVNRTKSTISSYVDRDPPQGIDMLCYKFIASNEKGSVESTPACTATEFVKPDQPKIRVTPTLGNSLLIELDQALLSRHSYSIFRGFETTALAAGITEPYVDSDLQEGTNYCYTAIVENEGNFSSDRSEQVCELAQAALPAPVTGLSSVDPSSDPTSRIRVTWTEVAGISRYEVVYRVKIDGQGPEDNWSPPQGNATNDTFRELTGLEDATVYEVRVRSARNTGEEIYSDWSLVTATTWLSFWPGNVVDDNTVNAGDATALVTFMGQESGVEPVTPPEIDWVGYAVRFSEGDDAALIRADTDRSGWIDIFDFLAVAANSGRTANNGVSPKTTPELPSLTPSQRATLISFMETLDENLPNQKKMRDDLAEILGVQTELPTVVALQANYPNPFNPVTRLSFDLPEEGVVKLAVYNTAGRLVSTLVDRTMAAGSHEVVFHAETLPSGIYFYQLVTGDVRLQRSMTLLK